MGTVARVATSASVFAATFALACSGADEPTAPVAPPSPTITVRVSPANASVEVGDTIRFAATVTDAAGQPVANPAVTWSTSQATQAWARDDGLVTGAGPGLPAVTATSQGATGTATLTVVDDVDAGRSPRRAGLPGVDHHAGGRVLRLLQHSSRSAGCCDRADPGPPRRLHQRHRPASPPGRRCSPAPTRRTPSGAPSPGRCWPRPPKCRP